MFLLPSCRLHGVVARDVSVLRDKQFEADATTTRCHVVRYHLGPHAVAVGQGEIVGLDQEI